MFREILKQTAPVRISYIYQGCVFWHIVYEYVIYLLIFGSGVKYFRNMSKEN